MNYHLYADDSQLYTIFKPQDITPTVENMEQCVASVRQWMNSYSLKMNDKKTEVLMISSKQLAKKISCPVLTIGDHQVDVSQAVRNIGVIMDSNGSMEQHINSVCRAAYIHIFNIGRIRKYLTKEAAEHLVHSFITSKLDYCNSLLHGLPTTLINKLQRVQNIAARIVTLTRITQHTTPVLNALHWLPVCQRTKFKTLLLVYKARTGMAPGYLQDLICPYHQERTLRSADQHLLAVPFTRSTLISSRAFGVCGPKMWNELPYDIRASTSLAIFKKNLKTYLFREYFQS